MRKQMTQQIFVVRQNSSVPCVLLSLANIILIARTTEEVDGCCFMKIWPRNLFNWDAFERWRFLGKRKKMESEWKFWKKNKTEISLKKFFQNETMLGDIVFFFQKNIFPRYACALRNFYFTIFNKKYYKKWFLKFCGGKPWKISNFFFQILDQTSFSLYVFTSSLPWSPK